MKILSFFGWYFDFVEVGWFVFLLGGMEAYSSLSDMLSMLHEAAVTEALGRGNQALSGSALEKLGWDMVTDLIGGVTFSNTSFSSTWHVLIIFVYVSWQDWMMVMTGDLVTWHPRNIDVLWWHQRCHLTNGNVLRRHRKRWRCWSSLVVLRVWVFPKIMVPPKSSILIGFSIINHPFWGVFPLFLGFNNVQHPSLSCLGTFEPTDQLARVNNRGWSRVTDCQFPIPNNHGCVPGSKLPLFPYNRG